MLSFDCSPYFGRALLSRKATIMSQKLFLIKQRITLHGPLILVDVTNFGLVIYNHANFYQFKETSSWSVE